MLVQANKQSSEEEVEDSGQLDFRKEEIIMPDEGGYVEDYGIRVARMTSQREAGLLL